MPSDFLNRFKRITYSTSYLPEVDGLRFLATFSVVVILHITHYIDDKFFNNHLIQGKFWNNWVYEGGHGVSLFFIISGFILSLPFAKWRLNSDKPVYLKKYFLRRLTRLEPPYLIALAVFFIGNVWVLDKYSFSVLFPHFLASAVYVHDAAYHSFSWVLPIAWSLEVEVQFYILAPLFCLIFLIRSHYIRWLILTVIILFNAYYWFNVWNVIHVFVYVHYFFSGILLADLYCCGIRLIKNERLALMTGILSLAGFLFIPSIHYLPGFFIKLLCMFLLFHTVLTNRIMKKLFSVRLIIIIGGMCYSIYLLHYGIVSAMGYLLMKTGIHISNVPLLPFLFMGLIIAVLVISSIYFLLVEKPFMKPWGLKKPNHQ